MNKEERKVNDREENLTYEEHQENSGKNDDFIMLPTVDFCFKELMNNEKVRKGFIAAVLGKNPEEIRRTTLIPTELRKDSGDDKLGILDVETGEQYTNLMELYILELKKLPEEDKNEKGVIRWMRFLSGKTKKEFEDMAEKDEYFEEAYNELKRLSMDEKKRLEYEARERAVLDYNTQMRSAERRGEKRGEKRGFELGERAAQKKMLGKMLENGISLDVAADMLEINRKEAEELQEEWNKEQTMSQ